MATREQLHRAVDALSDERVAKAQLVIKDGEPEIVGLPESWRTLPSGKPAPNWLALIDEARRGRD